VYEGRNDLVILQKSTKSRINKSVMNLLKQQKTRKRAQQFISWL